MVEYKYYILGAVIVATVIGGAGYVLTLKDFKAVWQNSTIINPELKYVVVDYQENEQAFILTKNNDSRNKFSRWAISCDRITFYEDGYRVSGNLFTDLNYKRLDGKIVNLDKKATKCEVKVIPHDYYVEIIRSNEYYANAGVPPSGTDGFVTERFRLPIDSESSMEIFTDYVCSTKTRKTNCERFPHQIIYEIRDLKENCEAWRSYTISCGNVHLSWFKEKDKFETFEISGDRIKAKTKLFIGNFTIDPTVTIGPVTIEYYLISKNLGWGTAEYIFNFTVNKDISKDLFEKNISLRNSNTSLIGFEIKVLKNATYNESEGYLICSNFEEANGTRINGTCERKTDLIEKWRMDWVDFNEDIVKNKVYTLKILITRQITSGSIASDIIFKLKNMELSGLE